MLRRNPYRDIEVAIGYRFKNKSLLEKALVHRSYRYEHPDIGVDNQRLEFLGDAVLGQAAAAHLFQFFSEKLEGEMTQIRSDVTSGKALERIARMIELGKHLRMGRGEDRSGGRDRPSNLADALEAILGGAWLDGGDRAVMKIFKKLFVPLIDDAAGSGRTTNPKGSLQEYCQRKWKKGPVYSVLRQEGPSHDMRFSVRVELPDGSAADASDRSKQSAEAAAARIALGAISSQAED